MKQTFCDRCGVKVDGPTARWGAPPETRATDGLPDLPVDFCPLCRGDFVKFMANERVLARER